MGYVVLIFNIILYLVIFLVWKKDCKEIGVDKLAVPLSNRLLVAFGTFTAPMILMLLTQGD